MSAINYSKLVAVPLLEGLHAEDFKALAPDIEIKRYSPGEILFHQGDAGGALMIVAHGAVELFIYDDNQTRVVLEHVDEGGFFGEVSLFDGSARTANAIATAPTEIWLLQHEVMTNFLRKYPDAAIHIITILSKRLRDANFLITAKYRDPFEILQEQSSRWDRLVDQVVRAVGSWPYLSTLGVLSLIWLFINGMHLVTWDIGFSILNIALVVIGALQLPLVMMNQRRQEAYEHVLADMDHQVNLKAQLALMDVTRKLDRVQETITLQVEHLERLAKDGDAASEAMKPH